MTQAKLVGGPDDGTILDLGWPHPKAITVPHGHEESVAKAMEDLLMYGVADMARPQITFHSYRRQPGSARWIHPYVHSGVTE